MTKHYFLVTVDDNGDVHAAEVEPVNPAIIPAVATAVDNYGTDPLQVQHCADDCLIEVLEASQNA